MNIKTTAAYFPVDFKQMKFMIVPICDQDTSCIYAEKKTGYFLSSEELAKIIADALDHGNEHQDNPYVLCDWKTEYIVNLFK